MESVQQAQMNSFTLNLIAGLWVLRLRFDPRKMLRMELTSCERASLQPNGCVTAGFGALASFNLVGMEVVSFQRMRVDPVKSLQIGCSLYFKTSPLGREKTS